MVDEHRSPLDRAFDLLIYAPVGLALTAKDELPALAGKGRRRLGAQITLARMIGQFAVVQGQKEAEKAAGRLAEQAATVASRLGGFPGVPGPTAAVTASAGTGSPGTGSPGTGSPGTGSPGTGSPDTGSPGTGTGTRASGSAQYPGRSNGASPVAGAGNGARPSRAQSIAEPGGRSADILAIPGYESLSASQVVQRLAGLSTPELEAVLRYEQSHRGRRTILSKIAQLQTDLP